MPASRSPGLASALLLTLLAAAAAAAAATVPDSGGWSHCTTPDLLHWNCSHPKTGFDGDTGSLTVTPKGTFAMWPTVGKAPPGIEMATPVSSALDEWVHHGVIGVPPNADGGLRDPGRAIQVREASAQCAIDVDDRARAQSAWLTVAVVLWNSSNLGGISRLVSAHQPVNVPHPSHPLAAVRFKVPLHSLCISPDSMCEC